MSYSSTWLNRYSARDSNEFNSASLSKSTAVWNSSSITCNRVIAANESQAATVAELAPGIVASNKVGNTARKHFVNFSLTVTSLTQWFPPLNIVAGNALQTEPA